MGILFPPPHHTQMHKLKSFGKHVHAPVVGGQVKHATEVMSSVKYPPEVVKAKSQALITTFDLDPNTPMKFRLIAPCSAYNDETNNYEHGELIITRKSIAFLSDTGK